MFQSGGDTSCSWQLPFFYHLQNLSLLPMAAESEEELLELAANWPPDVVLLNMDQVETARRLRKGSSNKEVLIAAVAEEEEPPQWPWDLVLTKPLTSKKVKNLLYPALVC